MYIIKNNEVGLRFKKQRFKKLLEAGNYRFIPSWSINVVKVNKKNHIEMYGVDVKAINSKALANKTITVQVKENEVAFHFVDDLFCDLLLPGTYTYFKDTYNHTFNILDTKNVFINNSIDNSVLESRIFQEMNKKYNIVKSYQVDEGFVGILSINGKFEQPLNPGKYYFFNNINSVNVKLINLKTQILQISGQELLTKDKVTLRMNFVLTYKVIDSVKVSNLLDNYQEQLYLIMQLALREYVSTKTLDELLLEKHEIGKIILESVKGKENDFGSLFIEAGVKDIILPGDIKEILNTILIAEKKALANVITRREETASTRSLLNTAKLMEENATLYKLKELEYLERICDKVGSISLSSSGGIIEQLNEIIKVSK